MTIKKFLTSFTFIYLLSLIDILNARNYNLGPLVDPGVFVITHIRSCRNGAGYCILGFSCEIDNDFEPDDLGGHCRGLGAAFSPVASFVCCKENPAYADQHRENEEIEAAIEAANLGELEETTTAEIPTTTTATEKVLTTTTVTDAPENATVLITSLATETSTIKPTTTEELPTTTEMASTTTIDDESLTISVVKPKLDFETDSTTPKIIVSTVPQDLNKITTITEVTEEDTTTMPSTTVMPRTKSVDSSEKRIFERRLDQNEKCGILGGQAVFQAFGRAAANLLPDLVASWVTGKSNGGQKRILTDEGDAQVTSTVIYCWLAAIVDKRSQKLICTGSLVRKDLVITTASCLKKILNHGQENYRVVLGDSNLMVNLPFGVQTRIINKAVVHPEFSPLTKENDLGIIQMDADVELMETVCLLCLPTMKDRSYRTSNCTVTGYGRAIRNEMPTELTDGILRTTILNVLDTEECDRSPSSSISPRKSDYRSLDRTICLGEKRLESDKTEDSCFIALDTGSPLSCRNEDGTFELAGVLSSGTTCSKDQSIFVNVSKYFGWISSLL